ncbi:4Fe-4S dicluster domain-containing protein [Chloroflexota bacterium]
MSIVALPRTILPKPSWRKQVEELSGEKISACYQCERCTNGCPVTFAMDIVPHKLIHLLSLGYAKETLQSDTIWVCASCENCSTRCPNGIDIAHIMDTLRQLAQREKIPASQANIPRFHNEFLSSIEKYGRVHELGVILRYLIKSEGLLGPLKWAGMGLSMFFKGKVKLLPHSIKATGQINDIFKQAERKE